MIQDKSSIHIYGWMLNELHLGGAMLIIYATIFSFTNGTDDHCFHGSANYLAEWAGISRQNVMRNLRRLEDLWLISRKERVVNGVKFVDYYATGCVKMRQGPSQNETSYNRDIESNISISNDIDNTSSPQEKNLVPIKQKTNIAAVEENPLPGPLPEPVESFLQDSYDRFPSIKYQVNKQKGKYFMTTIKDFEKLCQEYWKETVYTVLNYIKQDDFRSKQIQSIWKLRKKNKDWVPYMVVMLEKIQNYKPKVIDLDNIQ